MRRKVLMIFISIGLLLGTGLVRDHVFTNLNKGIEEGGTQNPKPSPFSAHKLILIKWGLTFLFSGIYLGISLMAVHFYFYDKNFLKITLVTFCILFFLSFLVAGAGFFLGIPDKGYKFARDIAGMVQSPLILMVLFPAFLVMGRGRDEANI